MQSSKANSEFSPFFLLSGAELPKPDIKNKYVPFLIVLFWLLNVIVLLIERKPISKEISNQSNFCIKHMKFKLTKMK